MNKSRIPTVDSCEFLASQKWCAAIFLQNMSVALNLCSVLNAVGLFIDLNAVSAQCSLSVDN